MTAQDHDALVHIGRQMAATNGYRPEQASDLYITSGTTRDYAYGVYRIFSYTFEMSNGDYMDDSLDRVGDRPEQERRPVPGGAGLVSAARCSARPYVTARCGAFDDDLEVARGWAANPDGTDTATGGRSAAATRRRRRRAGPKQLGTAPSGSQGVRDRRVRPASSVERERPRRPDDRSARAPIDAADDDRPAAVLPLRLRPRRNSSSADRLVAIVEGVRRRADGGRSPRPGSAADVDGAWRRRRSRSTRGPARRSASTSRRSMAARRTWSRSRSTTSG